MIKKILITGSTDGIGKLAAIKLAEDGHKIYLHGRNKEKLEKLIEEVKEQSNNVNINGFVADFSDLEAVKQMAQDVHKKLDKIDVLINNAGVFKSKSLANKDGLDLRFVVNYFAPYLLTKELIPLIKKAKSPRIINLSSAAQASVSADALSGKSHISMQASYAQSKLALTIWSFRLAQDLKNIAVIAVNPGSLLNTNMVKEAYGRFWSSADKGAMILYQLAVAEEHEGITGKYFDNDKGSYEEAHEDAYKEEETNRLIKQTEAIITVSYTHLTLPTICSV